MQTAGAMARRRVLMALLLAACGTGSFAAVAAEDNEKLVLAANLEFYGAFRERDMPTMAEVWGRREPIVVMHPGWPRLEGRKVVLESWRRILSNPNSPRIWISAAQVSFKEGRAIVSCTEHVGDGLIEAINVFEQQDGSWKMILHGAASVISKQT